MFFVYAPTYDYDSLASFQEFKTLSEVEAFIEKDLEKNGLNPFQNEAEDYTVIEGKELEVTTVKYASKIKIKGQN